MGAKALNAFAAGLAASHKPNALRTRPGIRATRSLSTWLASTARMLVTGPRAPRAAFVATAQLRSSLGAAVRDGCSKARRLSRWLTLHAFVVRERGCFVALAGQRRRWLAMLSQVLRSGSGQRHEAAAARHTMAGDEPAVVGVFPNRKTRTRSPPRLDHLRVRAGFGPHPLQEVEDQGVDRVGRRGCGDWSRPVDSCLVSDA